MCGIVAYIGQREAWPILIKGLHRLEYRGYDSAGVALINKDLAVYKCKGKVDDLVNHAAGKDTSGTIGIGHTRWATHGPPSDVNAHPHYSGNKKMVLIHNGIIENYASLKAELINRGHVFESETDTEVLVHLIEDIQTRENLELFEAVRVALNGVVGAYAIVVIAKDNPDQLIAARKSSPLVIKTIKNKRITPYIQELQLQLESIEKGGYDHFMLKEIFEQPRSIKDSMRGRINAREGVLALGGIRDYIQKFANTRRIIIIGCGTSWHAGLVAEYLFEDLARIPVEVEYASEFRYRNPVIDENDVVIAISQSGETADTLAAIELAKSKGATIFGVCNVVGSSIARATHAGSYTHAGPEIGVASTKAFTAQVTVLTLMALMIGHKRGTINESTYHTMLSELESIPDKVEKLLHLNDQIKYLASLFKDARNFLYLGRSYSFPVALEGALKLKEISYIHAEGYPAAEMKHGPIALIDEEMPVVVIATKGASYEKVVSNIQEVKARKGKIIAVVTEGDEDVKGMADYAIEIPATADQFIPLLAVVPLQLLAYHIAVLRGCNVDQPRNLAKSVTVE